MIAETFVQQPPAHKTVGRDFFATCVHFHRLYAIS